jgi:hypothetical protein
MRGTAHCTENRSTPDVSELLSRPQSGERMSPDQPRQVEHVSVQLRRRRLAAPSGGNG